MAGGEGAGRNFLRRGNLHFQADGGRAAVGVEAFDAREFLDDGERFCDGFPIEADDAGPALELVGAEAGK